MFEDGDVTIEPADEGGDRAIRDDSGALLKIEHDDGSITIRLDGRPLEKSPDAAPLGWWDNLADDIAPMELSRIAEDLLRGIRDDQISRTDWVESRADGIKLLGLKLDIPGLGGSADGAPVEGISRVRHPLLLEAVLRFQANARAEMLPTDGPVKVRDDSNGSGLDQDQLADALEMDLNHYLTTTATEYYPDTDRMLLMLGFGGTSFKKVYFCPLRQRPVSETVDADDLIVNQSATDLRNARRVTHRTYLRPSTVKRLQLLGVYRDVALSTPRAPDLDSAQREKKAQQGVSDTASNPEDNDREIYECYCELDISGYEHKWKGKASGLEVPYVVTIDVSSKQILSVVRNYEEDAGGLPDARAHFVKYTFVPGFGFYDIGLLHILGNTTNAVTAAWRELLDAGMYACFPGFILGDTGARQNTNIFRIPPGGAALVKTNGQPLRDAIMPLPYKEPSPALMQLVENIVQTGMRLGGTSEQQVGEGRADAPVGTTLALIEQATKVLNSVHKRMHAAQAEEFQLLVRVFREHPESFWQRNKKPAYGWDEKVFLNALDNFDLIPQADPNTASHTQRVMKVMALKQLQAASPSLYNPVAIDRAALQALGWNNPDQFMVPPEAAAAPPPELIQAQAKMRQEDEKAQAATITAQARMLDARSKAQAGLAGGGEELPLKAAELRLKTAQLHQQAHRDAIEDHNRDLDRNAKLEIERLKLAADVMREQSAVTHQQALKDKDIVAQMATHQPQEASGE
jgi:hypothetical protein